MFSIAFAWSWAARSVDPFIDGAPIALCQKNLGRRRTSMKLTKFKPLMAVLLTCYIDLAICGFQSLGSASETVNGMSNWTILRPHTIGQAADGSYFAEVVLLGTDRGDLCYAVWESPAGTYFCPGSNATVSGNFVAHRK
jgi:hypothetical protein